MLQPNFTPFPELRTERLLLRRMTQADMKEIFFLRSDPRVMQYIDKEPAKTLDDAKEYINMINKNIDENVSLLWCICLSDDPTKAIGYICLFKFQFENYRAELGYVLHPDHWRKGLIKEAIIKVMSHAFSSVKLHSIEANINPDNIASGAVLESAGFLREAYFKENYYYDGKFLDTAIYSLLEDNFNNRKK